MQNHRCGPHPVRAALLCLTALGAALTVWASEPEAAPLTPQAARARLQEGNLRFARGSASHPDQSAERRNETAGSQHPYAVVITCADSRVSPEIIFDAGIGDLFVIRNAGNLLDDHVLGSVEYAVEHLHVPLVVVMGHTKCGAVAAALAGGEAPGHLRSIVESLAPAVDMARRKPGDAADNAVRIGAKLSAAALGSTEPLVAPAVREGKVEVVAARYDVATGTVEFLP